MQPLLSVPLSIRISKSNSQSQPFSRSYRSNLPTSLTYFIPITRGFTPWRPDAVVVTYGSLHEELSPTFHGWITMRHASQNRMLITLISPILEQNSFHGVQKAMKERQHFLRPPSTSLDNKTLPWYTLSQQ